MYANLLFQYNIYGKDDRKSQTSSKKGTQLKPLIPLSIASVMAITTITKNGDAKSKIINDNGEEDPNKSYLKYDNVNKYLENHDFTQKILQQHREDNMQYINKHSKQVQAIITYLIKHNALESRKMSTQIDLQDNIIGIYVLCKDICICCNDDVQLNTYISYDWNKIHNKNKIKLLYIIDIIHPEYQPKLSKLKAILTTSSTLDSDIDKYIKDYDISSSNPDMSIFINDLCIKHNKQRDEIQSLLNNKLTALNGNNQLTAIVKKLQEELKQLKAKIDTIPTKVDSDIERLLHDLLKSTSDQDIPNLLQQLSSKHHITYEKLNIILQKMKKDSTIDSKDTQSLQKLNKIEQELQKLTQKVHDIPPQIVVDNTNEVEKLRQELKELKQQITQERMDIIQLIKPQLHTHIEQTINQNKIIQGITQQAKNHMQQNSTLNEEKIKQIVEEQLKAYHSQQSQISDDMHTKMINELIEKHYKEKQIDKKIEDNTTKIQETIKNIVQEKNISENYKDKLTQAIEKKLLAKLDQHKQEISQQINDKKPIDTLQINSIVEQYYNAKNTTFATKIDDRIKQIEKNLSNTQIQEIIKAEFNKQGQLEKQKLINIEEKLQSFQEIIELQTTQIGDLTNKVNEIEANSANNVNPQSKEDRDEKEVNKIMKAFYQYAILSAPADHNYNINQISNLFTNKTIDKIENNEAYNLLNRILVSPTVSQAIDHLNQDPNTTDGYKVILPGAQGTGKSFAMKSKSLYKKHVLFVDIRYTNIKAMSANHKFCNLITAIDHIGIEIANSFRIQQSQILFCVDEIDVTEDNNPDILKDIKSIGTRFKGQMSFLMTANPESLTALFEQDVNKKWVHKNIDLGAMHQQKSFLYKTKDNEQNPPYHLYNVSNEPIEVSNLVMRTTDTHRFFNYETPQTYQDQILNLSQQAANILGISQIIFLNRSDSTSHHVSEIDRLKINNYVRFLILFYAYKNNMIDKSIIDIMKTVEQKFLETFYVTNVPEIGNTMIEMRSLRALVNSLKTQDQSKMPDAMMFVLIIFCMSYVSTAANFTKGPYDKTQLPLAIKDIFTNLFKYNAIQQEINSVTANDSISQQLKNTARLFHTTTNGKKVVNIELFKKYFEDIAKK